MKQTKHPLSAALQMAVKAGWLPHYPSQPSLLPDYPVRFPTPGLEPKLPMYCLIVFGCYALAKIGLGLIAFKDCSADAALLDKVSMCLRIHSEYRRHVAPPLWCCCADVRLYSCVSVVRDARLPASLCIPGIEVRLTFTGLYSRFYAFRKKTNVPYTSQKSGYGGENLCGPHTSTVSRTEVLSSEALADSALQAQFYLLSSVGPPFCGDYATRKALSIINGGCPFRCPHTVERA